MKKIFYFVWVIAVVTACFSCNSNSKGDQNTQIDTDVDGSIESIESSQDSEEAPKETLSFSDYIRNIDSQASYKPVRMKTLTNTYYDLEEGPNGKMSHSMLDTIKGLAHFEFVEKAYMDYSDEDSIRYDMLAEIYMDTVYPSPKIQSFLFEKIDKELFDGFECDWLDGDSIFWANSKPYNSPDAKSFIEAWKPVIKQLSHSQYAKKGIKYYEILNSLSLVACHKVYEDENVVTYMLESGNSSHGGCGCRNNTDYYTFDKSSGELFDKKDLITSSNEDRINKAVNEAYKREYTSTMSAKPQQVISVNDANGIAILDEGILFYYLPYTIGCGAEGQYNFVLDKNLE